LAYLHRQNPPVLHRDIKPGNIKLTPGGLLKLVDFGLVKLLAPDDRTITIIQGRGTALYTPLEQYGGETGHTDVRSDIYSLGATLYHLLVNQPPVEAKQRFLTPGSLASVHKIRPEISRQTSQAIEWAMALHPDDRPENVVEFQRILLGKGSESPPVRRRQKIGWREAIRENRGLGITTILLLLIALLATLVSPYVPVL
jgi:serine/threonine-protein kinase